MTSLTIALIKPRRCCTVNSANKVKNIELPVLDKCVISGQVAGVKLKANISALLLNWGKKPTLT